MLDLTGQASEDDPHNETRKKRSDSNNSNSDEGTLTNIPNQLTYLPNPIDLWQQRTITSLLLLPIVFIIFILFQLPLHYNSTTETSQTAHTLSPKEWKGRAKDVTKLSNELNTVEKELDTVKDEQTEIRGMVKGLRRRLGKMKERRDRREVVLRKIREEREQATREEEEQEKQKQHHVQRVGVHIASLSMIGALGVPTFAGKGGNTVDNAKKDD